mgnify:CR=1 FL=1
MVDWQDIAKEYRGEIKELWQDIENALEEFEKGMPKSYKRGLSIIEKTLAISRENVRILSYVEPSGVSPKQQSIPKAAAQQANTEGKENNGQDRFKWLRNSE